MVEVIGFGLAAAVAWNLVTVTLGLPSSSGQALVGGLAGAAILEGGFDAVLWGGLDGVHPVGVIGVLIALAVSPPLGAIFAIAAIRVLRRLGRRATRRWGAPVRGGQWTASAALAFSHGAQDANLSVGAIAAMLLADGHIDSLGAVPTWSVVACAVGLAAGTAVGGWRIIRTVGRRIYRLQPIEGLASESSSAAVVLGGAILGGPVSTTQVVASSVVGVGAGRRRFHHVRWQVVRHIGLAWLLTIPATAGLAAASLGLWRWAT
jgi:PiT family inorganic phosphate transporter